jgi:hypothetical protein
MKVLKTTISSRKIIRTNKYRGQLIHRYRLVVDVESTLSSTVVIDVAEAFEILFCGEVDGGWC